MLIEVLSDLGTHAMPVAPLYWLYIITYQIRFFEVIYSTTALHEERNGLKHNVRFYEFHYIFLLRDAFIS